MSSGKNAPMGREAFAVVWSTVGAVVLYLTLNVWVVTQRALLEFPAITFDSYGPASASVFGIIMGGAASASLIMIWREFIRFHGGRTWPQRIPGLPKLDYDVESSLGKKIQALLVVLFLLVPLAGQVHFLNQLLQGTTYERTTGEDFASGWKEHLTKPIGIGVIWGDDYRLREQEGVTFFPFWEPWFLLLAVIGLLIFGGTLLWQIVGSQLGNWPRNPAEREQPSLSRGQSGS